jgi:hypothetical protein
MILKEMLSEYAKAHRKLTSMVGNVNKIEVPIIADLYDLKISRSQLTYLGVRVIFMLGVIRVEPACDRMSISGRKAEGLPLSVLYTGRIYDGHFQALVPVGCSSE